MLETPDVTREESLSSLDFAYMALMGVTLPMPYGTSVEPFVGPEDSEEEAVEFIRECARQVGVETPSTFEGIVSQIVPMSPATAMRRRGTVLVKGRGFAISLGCTKRIVVASEGIVVARYLVTSELSSSYWDAAGTLRGMVSL